MYLALEDVLSSAACILSAFVFLLSVGAFRMVREWILIIPMAASGAILAVALIQTIFALLSNDIGNQMILILSIVEIAVLAAIAAYSYTRHPKKKNKAPHEHTKGK
jgi:protein-S-isoprenylcysteine O-methyltransferase Ste14